ncbi:MAG TPA: hypothetical protein PKH93_05350 [Chitinophagales bacterium]|nr:hypothetical protein [Chitinophagales bacterium]HNL06980.1 hypothetical protein [Chitinophagales bacterium]
MAYNKFKIDDLTNKLGLSVLVKPWLPIDLPSVRHDSLLETILSEATKDPINSEKARSESIVAPVLKTLRRHNPDVFNCYSGYPFNIDAALSLVGFCDFIISLSPYKPQVEAPVFCIIEAKKDDVEPAWGQCGAAMYAARLFNQQKGKQQVIYGVVTTAFTWCFMRLDKDNQLLIDPNYVPLTFTNPYSVLSALQWILDCSLLQSAS